MNKRALVSTAGLLTCIASVHGDPIVLDPDDFEAGTMLNGALESVQLEVRLGATDSNLYSVLSINNPGCCDPRFPKLFGNVLGYLSCPTTGPNFRDGWGTSLILRATIDRSSVELFDFGAVVAGASSTSTDRGMLRAKIAGQIEPVRLVSGPLETAETAVLSLLDIPGVDPREVEWVEIGANGKSGGITVVIDQLFMDTSDTRECIVDPDCDDGNACTADSCFGQFRCINKTLPCGACCFPVDVCVDATNAGECASVGGSYLANGAGCSDDPDNDGVFGCDDLCPYSASKVDPGLCGCDLPDVDSDLDGVPDCNDHCLDTGPGIPVNDSGCPRFGACCFPNRVCFDDVLDKNCRAISGVYQGDGKPCVEGCLFPGSGDVDSSGLVNHIDFSHWDLCVTGPGTAIADPACVELDMVGDDDIDLEDLALIQQVFLNCSLDAACDDGNKCTLDTCDAVSSTCTYLVGCGGPPR